MLGFLSGKPTSKVVTDGIIGTVLDDYIFLNAVHQPPEFFLNSLTRDRLHTPSTTSVATLQ